MYVRQKGMVMSYTCMYVHVCVFCRHTCTFVNKQSIVYIRNSIQRRSMKLHVHVHWSECTYIVCYIHVQYTSDARYMYMYMYKARVILHVFARGGKVTCTLRQICLYTVKGVYTCTRRQTGLHEEANALVHWGKYMFIHVVKQTENFSTTWKMKYIL